jgi:ComF family protein
MRALPRIGCACTRCALPVSGPAVCGACLKHPPPFSATVAALAYAFPVDRLLQRIKYEGRLALAEWAGTALALAVDGALALRSPDDRPDRIVALPLSAARQRERGFNQAREIAVRVSRASAIALDAPLERMGEGLPQAALPWVQRRVNVKDAFAVRGEVTGARIALVDDVMTTGATLAEASRALLRAGAVCVECWVVARTLPP